jgi:mycofactocin precursor
VSDPKTDAEITPEEGSLLESELLVEDVSIDGMCGVY